MSEFINSLKKANTDRLIAYASKIGVSAEIVDRETLIELLVKYNEAENSKEEAKTIQTVTQSASASGSGAESSGSTGRPPITQQQALTGSTKATPPAQARTINIMEIENGVRKFSGDDNMLIRVWVAQFEEYAELMQWTPIQKLVAAKRSLTGTALMVSQLTVSRSFEALRDALLDEFDQVRTSKEVHAMLGATRMNKEESLLAYTVRMQELAQLGDVDNGSLMQYVIDGIDDRHENKVLLYGANTMREFKNKLNVYRTFKLQTPTQEQTAPRYQQKNTRQTADPNTYKHQGTVSAQQATTTCTFCNKRGHDEAVCRQKKLFVSSVSRSGIKQRHAQIARQRCKCAIMDRRADQCTRQSPSMHTVQHL